MTPSKRTAALAVTLVAALVAASLPTGAELLEEYLLVLEDPPDDAVWTFAPVGGNPQGTFDVNRVDIHNVQMATEADQFQVKLAIGATPAGTSGYMYHVQVNTADAEYFVCWTVHWTGGQDSQDDVAGCDVFDGQRVGPTTRGNGVDVRTVEGESFVRWEVPRSAIGDAADGAELVGIFATTWVRGADAGSSWRQADRAMDEGEATYTLGAGPSSGALDVSISLEAPSREITVGPGENATYSLFLGTTQNATANLTLSHDLPESFTAEFLPDGPVLTDVTNGTQVDLRVGVPADSGNVSQNFTVIATSDGNVTVGLEFVLHVDASLVVQMPEASGNETTEANQTAPPEEVPGMSAVAGLAALACIVMARRRRS